MKFSLEPAACCSFIMAGGSLYRSGLILQFSCLKSMSWSFLVRLVRSLSPGNWLSFGHPMWELEVSFVEVIPEQSVLKHEF